MQPSRLGLWLTLGACVFVALIALGARQWADTDCVRETRITQPEGELACRPEP